jgi:hypothetical protein
MACNDRFDVQATLAAVKMRSRITKNGGAMIQFLDSNSSANNTEASHRWRNKRGVLLKSASTTNPGRFGVSESLPKKKRATGHSTTPSFTLL